MRFYGRAKAAAISEIVGGFRKSLLFEINTLDPLFLLDIFSVVEHEVICPSASPPVRATNVGAVAFDGHLITPGAELQGYNKLSLKGRLHSRLLRPFLRPQWRRRPTASVIARGKQRKQLDSGAIADGETDAPFLCPFSRPRLRRYIC
jgi:hypothetical protein